MSNLVKRVEAALRDLDESLWFPGLADELADKCWHDLYRNTGLSPTNYGTVRLVARDGVAPRRIITVLPMSLCADVKERCLLVEILSEDIACHYKEAGVQFYTAEEIGEDLLEQIREAIEIIRLIPTLFTTVAALVRSIHLIKLEGDDYDVSFSEPYIPFSIFVSVSQMRSSINALRIAEALVHEAMHLQLTLIEQRVSLILLNNMKYFSPWKREYRTPQGILHALYVFRVIDRFLEELSLQIYLSDEARYIYTRRREIAKEVTQVKSFQECPDLTPIGSTFVRRLMLTR